jgi:hypothetical protein
MASAIGFAALIQPSFLLSRCGINAILAPSEPHHPA